MEKLNKDSKVDKELTQIFKRFDIKKVLKESLTIQRIAYMCVFTATSVSLVLVFNTFIPIIIIQSFRVAFAGIFIKVAGLVLGPIIGALTGLLTDIFLLILRPADYHPGYTLVLILFGLIAGLAFFVREKLKERKNRNITFFITIIFLIIVAIATVFIYSKYAPDTIELYNISFLKLRQLQVVTLIVGSVIVFLTVVIGLKFVHKKNTKVLNDLLVIVMMNVLVDFIISQPLISYFDGFSATSGVPYISLYMSRLGTSTITVLWNTLLIYAIWRVLQPLVWRRLYS